MFDWVSSRKIEEEMGLTKSQVNMRRARGHWVYGIHYKKFDDGKLYYCVKAIREWQNQQAAA